MGEGTQDIPTSKPEEGMDIPEVHTTLLPPSIERAPDMNCECDQAHPPSTLNTDSYSAVDHGSNTLYSYPYPDSPVICALPGSLLSTPANSPPLCRPVTLLPYSSTSSLAEEYMEKLHGYSFEIPQYRPYSNNHLPSPIANTSNLGVVDSTSMMLPNFSLDTKSNMSDSMSMMLPFCRICHMPGSETEILTSPCRCAGSMQFIHNTCLMKWLEITSKHSRKPPKCELCHFQYHRHKKFKFHQFRCPKVSRQDRVLHSIFLVMMILMIGCAIATVMCFLSDKGQISKLPRNKVDLTTEEIITLSCGVLFFVSFFVAMSVQIKAKHTVYQLFLKFIMQNMEWEIDEYDKFKDNLFLERQIQLHKKISPTSFKIPPAYV